MTKNRALLLSVVALLTTFVLLGPWLAVRVSRGEDTTASKTDTPPTEDPANLEVVGTLAASHLYQTYLNVGLLADARTEGVYDTATAQGLLNTVVGLVDSVDKQLAKVAKSKELSREDKEALTKITKQSAQLRQVVTALETFWKSNKKEDGAKYEKLRKEAWAGIQKLLGLEG